MKKHCRRLTAILTHSSIFAATVFSAFNAHAATLGHSRVISAPDEPLRVVVQVKDLSSADLQSVSAQIAPAAAWQEAGLTPPVELGSLSTHLLPGPQENVMQLVVQSRLAATDNVLDVLVDVSTDASTQRHQVSVLQTQRPRSFVLPEAKAPEQPSVQPLVTAPTAKPQVTTAEKVTKTTSPTQTRTIKKGDHLFGVARELADDRYNNQQLMAALVEANPHAFIDDNMNLLRAEATLSIPDAETVMAITPQQAREAYQIQLEQFDEYRQRVAKGEPATRSAAPSNKQEKAETQEIEANTDRLQLSAQTDDEAKKDQKTATAQELAHTAQRLTQLESGADAGANSTAITAETEKTSAVDGLTATPTSTAAISEVNAAAVDDNTAKEAESNTVAATSSWLSSNIISVVVGLLVLVALLVAWFLRRAQSTKMEYAEIVPASSVRTREKAETAEAEFREIK